MRVLYWTELFWPYVGGVEVLASRLLPALAERGHALQVLTSHGALDLPDEDAWEGIPIRRAPIGQALASSEPARIGDVRRQVLELKREFRPELVHLNLTAASVFFEVRTRSEHRCPLLLSVRLALPEGAAGPRTLLRAALSSADAITANSTAIGDDLRRLAPDCAARISVIPNGLEPPGLEPAPLPFDPPVVVCLGRVVTEKGFDVAIEAFALLRDRFPAARLVIAGDGPERLALEAQAAASGLEGAVEFTGWVSPERVPELLNRATVVAVPSRWREAFGLVALQAALMARPVVASHVGGLPEVVADGATGRLVDREDVPALAEALAAILAEPDRATALGRHARQRAVERFGLREHVDAYDRLYRSLAA